MKKYITIFGFIVISIGVFLLQFQYQKTYQPHTYYQVYLDGKVLGVIDSREKLEEYISNQGTLIKNQVLQYQEELEVLENVDSIMQDKLASTTEVKTYQNMVNAYQELEPLIHSDGSFDQENRDKVIDCVEVLGNGEFVRVESTKIEDYDAFQTLTEEKFKEQKSFIMDIIDQRKDQLKLTEIETFNVESYHTKNYQDVSYVKQKYMEDYVDEYNIYLYADDIYSPLGINVEKINTYHANLSPVEDVYELIVQEKPCTIEGYQFRIKREDLLGEVEELPDEEDDVDKADDEIEDVIIYVTDEQVFRDAVEQLEVIFVGAEDFEKFKNGTQSEIIDTGTRIDDVYVSEDITIKQTNISVGEKIYSDANELSSFLLYGENKKEKVVYTKATDTILSLTYEQGITVEEFFLSNPTFNSVNNILYENQPVVIAETNPQISIVVETFEVEDIVINYDQEERYDKTLNLGMRKVVQKGENGLMRASQNVKSVNGAIANINPQGSQVLKSAQNEIIAIGTKEVPTVGSLASWYWPTRSGYTISSYFGYRNSPFGGGRELHTGIDIAGTGEGSPVYASNNGTIYYMGYQQGGYGYHIIIDHHNGFYSLYGHMRGFASGMKVGATVARGDTIGYVGHTGAATGPHLHFEIRRCPKYSTSCFLNPLPYLRR